jgi:hypothetical protein
MLTQAPATPATTPFGRPAATQCPQRIYKPADGHMTSDGYGPSHVASCNIAPQGRGGHCVEYAKPAGHCIALAFAVSSDNVAADFFQFAKETNGSTRVECEAYITDANGRVIAHYSGRQTTTDEPHAWYVVEGAKHNGATKALPAGIYFYWFDTPDGSAAKLPVWHSGSNKFN